MKGLAYYSSKKVLPKEGIFLSKRSFLEKLNHVDQIWEYLKNNSGHIMAVNDLRGKHNEKYTTLYAHLSKFKSGVQKGSYVKQGDIIGYVGSTGYSTGPHLHYEFMLYGKHVDPYKQALPPSLPLKKENTEEFNKVRDEYTKILQNFVK